MKKRSIALLINFVILIITLSIGVFFLFYMQPVVRVSAENYDIEEQIYDEANFEEDSIIIVLKSKSSRFRGISSDLREKIYSIGGQSIEDLSEIPDYYVNVDGSINENRAPSLYSYYNETAFKQILYVKLLTPGKENVLNAIEAVQKFDEVDYVGPNRVEEIGTYVPNDAYYSQQWALNSVNGINIETAWDIARGNNEIRVGIIDSGIATDMDLNANIQTGYDFYNGNTITNDSLGGHGTHVAGIIGAIGNNNLGVSGVAPNVQLVPLQTAYNTAGSGYHYTSERLAAINYAISLWEDEDQRISILNHSISGFGTNTDIAAAINNFPGLFIWAAGNDNNNTDTFSQISQFNLPNVISVGALTSTGQRASYSNYGQNSVTIYAPGSDILSTFPSNLCVAGTCTANNSGDIHYMDGYHIMSGTSMAAPHVTGVAALMLSVEPTLTASRIKEIILSTADDISISVPNGTQNVKKLNAYEAVSYVSSPLSDLFAGGSGFINDPYLISNAEQFDNIRYAHRSVYVPPQGGENQITYAFRLTNNITLTGDWTPFPYKFTGDFDGNGHYISYSMNLTKAEVNESDYHGLFGFVSGSGRIYDLELMNCTITSDDDITLPSSGPTVCIGILSGSVYSAGGIEDVTVTNPKIECKLSGACIGALAGSIRSTSVTDCVVRAQNGTASITNNTHGYLGGMAGMGDVSATVWITARWNVSLED